MSIRRFDNVKFYLDKTHTHHCRPSADDVYRRASKYLHNVVDVECNGNAACLGYSRTTSTTAWSTTTTGSNDEFVTANADDS